MKFNLEERSFMSHLLLNNRGFAIQVSETDQWKNDETLEANLEINGIEVPAELLESFFQYIWDKSNEQHRVEYDADVFDRKVEEKAKQILKEYSDNAVDKLHHIIEVISNPENIIKPEWERDK